MFKQLHALTALLRGAPPGAASRRHRRRFVPGMECLETRLVPSTFTVTTTRDTVANDGKLSLREAITKANHHPGPDVIVLRAGVYKITRAGANDDANLTGDFDITDSVTIRGAGPRATVVDALHNDRVFDILSNTPLNVTFQGLTVRNGSVTGDGGGIRDGAAEVVVRQCVITGNQASVNGGGIFTANDPADSVTLLQSALSFNIAGRSGGGIFGNTAALIGSTVSGNTAGTDAGGIELTTATLLNSAVTGNTALGDTGGLDATTMVLTGCTVSGNTARSDIGGISGGTLTMTNSAVSGNTATGIDGGISFSTVTLTGCTVSGNSAGDGEGGIDAGTATVTNCTVSGNSTARGPAGGIFALHLTLLNVTVTANRAHTGVGVFLMKGGTSSVTNTIIAQNFVDATGSGPDVSGDFTSGGHNLIGDGTGSTGFTNTGDQVGTAANPLDPRLGPLANNGGPTLTHALLAGSPAIDRGTNTGAPATDQRGVSRPRDGDGNGSLIVDIGAFER